MTEKLDGENTTIYADGYTPRALGLQRLSPDAHLGAGAGGPRRARAARRLADLRREHLRAALDRLRPAAVVLPAVRRLRRQDTCLSWADTEAWAARLGARPVPAALPRPVRARDACSRCSAAPPRSGPSARASCCAGRTRSARRAPARGRQARPPRPRQDRPALDARRGDGQWTCPRRLSAARRARTCASTGCRGWTRWRETPQSPVWHGEGDVLIHTRMVADGLLRDERHQALDDDARAELWLAALLHDVGKPATTRYENGHYRAPGHARARRDHRPPAAVGGGDRAGGARADLRARPPPHGPAPPDRARERDPPAASRSRSRPARTASTC